MKEIIGENLKVVISDCGLFRDCVEKNYTYVGKIGSWYDLEIWLLDDSDYEVFKNYCESIDIYEWFIKYPKSWWRYSEGSVLGNVNMSLRINGRYLKCWNNYNNKIVKKSYKNIYDYIYEYIGASTESNVVSILVDLAKQNNMSVKDLLIIYGKS